MDNGKNINNWTLTIRPVSGWFDFRLGELWRYRDLIMLFVWRDFVAIYKQTILGPLWYLIQPIMTTLIFTVIFGKVAKIPTDVLPFRGCCMALFCRQLGENFKYFCF